MEQAACKAASLNLVGGRICLDFLNTADWHFSEKIVEHLKSYRDLVLWGGHALGLGKGEIEALLNESTNHPSVAAKVYNKSLVLREALLQIFDAILRQETPAQKNLDIFNGVLSKTMRHLELALISREFSWRWREAGDNLNKVLWPVVRDAADLLTSEQLQRVSRCADDRCGWFFIDTSRNRSRRWCDMKDCGNRAKVRRHYRRQQD